MLRAVGRIGALAMVFATLVLSGCAGGGRAVDVIDMQTDLFSVPVNGSDNASIEINLGVGELRIEGGATAVCSGELRYNVVEWKPVVENRTEGGSTVVRITQPSLGRRTIGSKARSSWTLAISDEIPMELRIDVGVGESHIDISDAMVQKINVDTGVGEVVIDVTNVRQDLAIDVDSGVGSVTIHVPGDIGIHVKCDRGIGSFEHSGLTRTTNGYVNAAYGQSASEITIRVDSGVGDVHILTDGASRSI
ncbi:toast rack family protein [bacterium]|nr:toast rack family protein [bacterium]